MKMVKILLLLAFSFLFTSGLIAATNGPDKSWLDEFKKYAVKNGFEKTLKEYLEKGEPISSITSAALQTGEKQDTIALVILQNVAPENKNNAICGLSSGGVAKEVLAQASSMSVVDIDKIIGNCDMGLGFSEEPPYRSNMRMEHKPPVSPSAP